MKKAGSDTQGKTMCSIFQQNYKREYMPDLQAGHDLSLPISRAGRGRELVECVFLGEYPDD